MIFLGDNIFNFLFHCFHVLISFFILEIWIIFKIIYTAFHVWGLLLGGYQIKCLDWFPKLIAQIIIKRCIQMMIYMLIFTNLIMRLIEASVLILKVLDWLACTQHYITFLILYLFIGNCVYFFLMRINLNLRWILNFTVDYFWWITVLLAFLIPFNIFILKFLILILNTYLPFLTFIDFNIFFFLLQLC